jgi:hypothetical protein
MTTERLVTSDKLEGGKNEMNRSAKKKKKRNKWWKCWSGVEVGRYEGI